MSEDDDTTHVHDCSRLQGGTHVHDCSRLQGGALLEMHRRIHHAHLTVFEVFGTTTVVDLAQAL
jgi:hypothetical protein